MSKIFYIKLLVIGLSGLTLFGCGAVNTLSDKELLQSTEFQTEPETEEIPDIETEAAEEKNILKFVDAWGEWYEAEIHEDFKAHTYDWSYLENDGKDIRYTGDSRYSIRKGVDVSYHQGNIQWDKVKAAGYDFAFIRLGYRGYGDTGSLNVDDQFPVNLENAHKAGVDVGVYFFSQAVNESEAIEEAEFVLNHLKGISLELPVVYDPELIRDDEARTDNVTGEQFTRNTITFCEKIKEAGYQPMIYSNMYWEAFLYDLKQLQEYPVWYADYEAIPQTPYEFIFWQYSESGIVDGIEGIVDLNVQFMEK